MGKLDSIDQVQSTESDAKERIEKASSGKVSRIQKANDEAVSIVNEAMENAKSSKMAVLKSTEEKISKESRKAVEDAHKHASKIRNATLSKEKAKKAAKQIAHSIIGA